MNFLKEKIFHKKFSNKQKNTKIFCQIFLFESLFDKNFSSIQKNKKIFSRHQTLPQN